MANSASWLGRYFFGTARWLGVDFPTRGFLEFAGSVTVEDDPSTNATRVTVGSTATTLAGGTDNIALVTASTVRASSGKCSTTEVIGSVSPTIDGGDVAVPLTTIDVTMDGTYLVNAIVGGRGVDGITVVRGRWKLEAIFVVDGGLLSVVDGGSDPSPYLNGMPWDARLDVTDRIALMVSADAPLDEATMGYVVRCQRVTL